MIRHTYLLTILFIASGFFSVGQDIIYVDIDARGSGDGTSWANAYTDLQVALDTAKTGSEIWIMEGVYLPTESPDGTTYNNRDKAFHFNKNLQLYGGFDGTEVTLDQRKPKINPTILSGDFNGDDLIYMVDSTLTIENNKDNAYHILLTTGLTSHAVIDGFTISGGNANHSGSISYSYQNFPREKGGGMSNKSSSPVISNTTFVNNSANYAGAVYNGSSSPDLIHDTLIANTAYYFGGAIFNDYRSSPNITNSFLIGNCTAGNGAGIYNYKSSPSITNSIIISNRAARHGGGIYNAHSSPNINNSTFTGNHALEGGHSIYNYHSTLYISESTFTENRESENENGI